MKKKGIITVVGKDAVGIMARTCTYLAKENINILDISQGVLEDYFNMMMIVDLTENMDNIGEHVDNLSAIGQEIGVIIKLQLEDIFSEMHRI